MNSLCQSHSCRFNLLVCFFVEWLSEGSVKKLVLVITDSKSQEVMERYAPRSLIFLLMSIHSGRFIQSLSTL